MTLVYDCIAKKADFINLDCPCEDCPYMDNDCYEIK